MLPTQKSPAPAELKEIWFLQTALYVFSLSHQFGLIIAFFILGLEGSCSHPCPALTPSFQVQPGWPVVLWTDPGAMLLFSLFLLTKFCWYFYISEQAADPHWLTSCQLFFGCLFSDNQLAQTEWALCNSALLRSQQGGGFHVRLNHEIYIFHLQKQMPQWAPWCLSKAVRSGEAQT